ncbi:MAG: sigma-54-dependent Fis family transcriptional regulator [Candidatus Rokubacteria bacterium]|nr:sigma-54-dependent Fis family transcriptional regulator [Candidatus Rokubacteria bacterium]
MSRKLRVLVADDEKNLRELLLRELTRKGHEVEGAADGMEALERLKESSPDVVLLDIKMPRMEGIDLLRELQRFPEAPQAIVMTGFQDVSTAVEAMKLGAYDYLTKPAKIEELDVLIRKAAEKGRLIRENIALRARVAGGARFGGILTRSPKMLDVLALVERVAPTDSTVLILGESGTGKELVARAIHERSPRAREAFAPIHCGALPREVLESELFGHEKGAFTGAVETKPGLIELADGGTLFLDEIGELEPDSQVKLLRVLETGSFFRVGGTRTRAVDARVVTATNRDLSEAMRAGQFRQDLYYRINTITLWLPPLRERNEDIALLAEHFLQQNAGYGVKRLSAKALGCLEAYDWPGNVRELQHAIERATILSRSAEIQPDDLPSEVRCGEPGRGPSPGSLEEIERQHIIATLRQVGGHRGKAAALLRIDPKTLYRKILSYKITPDLYK